MSTLIGARDGYDGARHHKRRELATERLGTMDAPRSVLFVCLGNVCRSPYAAWSLRKTLKSSDIKVDSAGFIGPDRNPPEIAIEAARARGVEHGANNSQLVTDALLAEADVVFLFQPSHSRELRRLGGSASTPVFLLCDFDPLWAGKRAIIDPWGKPLEEFHRTFERIDRCLERVRKVLT